MGLIGKVSNSITSLSKYVQHKNTDRLVKQVLDIADFEPIIQTAPKKLENVIFVTPYMSKHSGGLTSVLRIAMRLSENNINVYFTCPTNDNLSEMMINANDNLSCYQAKYINWKEAKKNVYDFVIAVQDTYVYYARKLNGYLIYFVQDYEPYFNPVGDRYFLSKKSLELGEDIISLGKWNLQEINRNIVNNKLGKLYSIEFPFEVSEYPLSKKDFKNLHKRKEINFAVYIKREAKRLPGIIMNLLNQLYEDYDKENIRLNIFYFGLHSIEKVKYGINMGRISKTEIKKLYDKCDFGMVASMTNISLVPYEMIASGLPVIEFADGSYGTFLGEDTAILLESFSSKELKNKMDNYINNIPKLNSLCEKAQNKIKKLSWDISAEQFKIILENITIEDKNNGI